MKLTIEVGCGEKTCAYAPKQFCAFFGSRKFGQIPVCMLFPELPGDSVTVLETQGEWTLRCAACLESQEVLSISPTVTQIVREYLISHNYDGLFNADDGCACTVDDLRPCGEHPDCTPGYKGPCDCGEHDFHISVPAQKKDA
jgi:hypothetical protein